MSSPREPARAQPNRVCSCQAKLWKRLRRFGYSSLAAETYPLGCTGVVLAMTTRRLTVGFSLLTLIGVACSGEPTAPLPASLNTDAAHYVAAPGPSLGTIRQYSFTIIARFTNRSAYTVHLGRCFSDTPFPIHGILNAGGDTTVAYDPGWSCVGGNFFHVAPGETRVDTLPIQAPWGVDGRTHLPIGVFEGRFALTYSIYGCTDEALECESPLYGTTRSAVFTVTKAK